MNGLSLILCLTMAQMPEVQIETLKDEQYRGTLQSFTAESVAITTGEKTVNVPIGDLLSIQSKLPNNPQQDPAIEIRLVDGSTFRVSSIVTSGSEVTVAHSRFGTIKFSLSVLSTVRFAPSEPKIDAEWNQLLERKIKKDNVAIRKGDVLDHLDGIVGTLNETTLQFQLEGDDVPIKREKIFGLIYSKREPRTKQAIARMEIGTGDVFAVGKISWNNTSWNVVTVTGLEFEFPAELFRSLDYSLGKVSYLSDLKPRNIERTEFISAPDKGKTSVIKSPFSYRANMDFDGELIRLYTKPNEITSYQKGIAVHSKTTLTYRLGGEFRRFQAIMGIGAEIPWGAVHVEIRGDKKNLFISDVIAVETEAPVRGQRAMPHSVDLDVTDIVELEIIADWANNNRDQEKPQGQIRQLETGGRLNIGNARLIK